MRYLSGGGKDDTVGQIYRRAEIERGEADGIQENGDPEGGSMATIERVEAEAIQENGDPEGGSTATIERGEAEAIQNNGAAGGAVRRQSSEEKQRLYKTAEPPGRAGRRQ